MSEALTADVIVQEWRAGKITAGEAALRMAARDLSPFGRSMPKPQRLVPLENTE